MKKLFAIAAVVVIALLALLLMQLEEPATTVEPAKREVAAAPAAAPVQGAAELAIAAQKVREAQERGDKVDPASDAMIYRLDERVPAMLTAPAAKCYEGGLSRVHRNQSVRLGFKLQVKDSVVSVKDIKILASSINDQKLVDCFIREVAAVTWRDDQLPDWEQDDELTINPERGMKKFTKDNLAYEGDGPIGKIDGPAPAVAASREMPADAYDARKTAAAETEQ